MCWSIRAEACESKPKHRDGLSAGTPARPLLVMTVAFAMTVCLVPRSVAQEGTCCTRDVTVVPCDMPEEQERDDNGMIEGSIMTVFTNAWVDFDDCPLRVDFYDFAGARQADALMDALARIMGAEKDPQAVEFAKSLLRFDYVMRPEVTLRRIDDIVPGEWEEGYGGEPWYEPGYVHGDWTIVFALEDVHHGQTVKQASTSWSGSLAYDGIGPMKALAEQFLPLDDLIHDYERMPESTAVIPEDDEIEAGRSMTVDLTDIRDSKGRISQPWPKYLAKNLSGYPPTVIWKFGKPGKSRRRKASVLRICGSCFPATLPSVSIEGPASTVLRNGVSAM